MKKMLSIVLLAVGLSLTTGAMAQEDTTKKSIAKKVTKSVKKGTKKAWKGTKKVAKTVGDETAETATKAKS